MYAESKIGLPEFDKVPKELRQQAMDEIRKECGWRWDADFSRKKNGKVKITPAEVYVISDILKKYGVELKTDNHEITSLNEGTSS